MSSQRTFLTSTHHLLPPGRRFRSTTLTHPLGPGAAPQLRCLQSSSHPCSDIWAPTALLGASTARGLPVPSQAPPEPKSSRDLEPKSGPGHQASRSTWASSASSGQSPPPPIPSPQSPTLPVKVTLGGQRTRPEKKNRSARDRQTRGALGREGAPDIRDVEQRPAQSIPASSPLYHAQALLKQSWSGRDIHASWPSWEPQNNSESRLVPRLNP